MYIFVAKSDGVDYTSVKDSCDIDRKLTVTFETVSFGSFM